MVRIERAKSTPLMCIVRAGVICMVLLAASKENDAQVNVIPLPVCGEDIPSLESRLKSTSSPEFVLRAAAVGGTALVPTLKSLARKGQPVYSVGGAAQVSLARLDDHDSLAELDQEFQANAKSHNFEIFQTIQKLGAVRNDAALVVLMKYLVENERNIKRKFDSGDVVEDPIADVIRQVASMVEDPPFGGTQPPAPYYESQLDGWRGWWERRKPPYIQALYWGLDDPKARCLVRLAQWGDGESVLELYQHSGKTSLPVVKHLAQLGDKSWQTSPMGTVRGNAQTILAKEGDHDEFDKIARELDDLPYEDGVAKLRFIGGRQSFEVLLDALSLRAFMRSERWKYYDRSYMKADEQKLQKAVMATLSELVRNPPLPPEAVPSPENVSKWNDWWVKNKNDAVALP
jgi:hypothetical protein